MADRKRGQVHKHYWLLMHSRGLREGRNVHRAPIKGCKYVHARAQLYTLRIHLYTVQCRRRQWGTTPARMCGGSRGKEYVCNVQHSTARLGDDGYCALSMLHNARKFVQERALKGEASS